MKNAYNKGEKNIIYYSRDYRHLNRVGIGYIMQLFFVLMPIIIVYLCSYRQMSCMIARFSAGIINMIIGERAGIFKENYLPVFGEVYCVSMSGRTPSEKAAIISLIVTLVLIILLVKIKSDRKPFMIFLTIGLCVHLVSSIFFVFLGDKFPYNMDTYSILYMKQQIMVWLMIIVAYWLATSLITHVFFLRILSLSVLMIISFVYGITRYILYMLIISRCTYLFMAVLYFTFGVLFDFLVLVGIFAMFIENAGRKFKNKKRGEIWRWS